MSGSISETTALLAQDNTPQNSTSRSRGARNAIIVAIPSYFFLFCTILLSSLPISYLAIDLREKKDVTESSSALIISSYTFAYVVSCIVSPKLDNLYDSHLMMMVSGFVLIIINILFSYLLYLPKVAVFPAGVVARLLGGFCAGLYENVFAAWIVRSYKDKIGTLVSVAEGVINLGWLIGPLIGGFLFKWTNSFSHSQLYCISPIIIAFGTLAAMLVCYRIKENRLAVETTGFSEGESQDGEGSSSEEEPPSFFRILSRWQIMYVLSQTFWLTLFECVISSILGPYLQPVYPDYSATFLAGAIFFFKGISYSLGSIPTGYLTDQPKYVKYTLFLYVLSPFFVGSGMVVAGLQTFIPSLKPTLPRLIAPSLVVSFGSGFGSGIMLRYIMSLWKGLNPNDRTDYTAYLTSFFLVTYSLGEAIGNAIGGVMYRYVTFEQLMGVWGCVSLFYCLCNGAFVAYTIRKPYMKYVRVIEVNTSNSIQT